MYDTFYVQKITNLATVRNVEIISGKFNEVKICSSGNYEQKLITTNL
jgi:hypothetical protein